MVVVTMVPILMIHKNDAVDVVAAVRKDVHATAVQGKYMKMHGKTAHHLPAVIRHQVQVASRQVPDTTAILPDRI